MSASTSDERRPTSGAASRAPDADRIGPNAVIQLRAALRAGGRDALAADIFAAAGEAAWLETLPDKMVEERRVARVHRAVRAALSPKEADELMADAGRRTADYLLANRIPRPAQAVLKRLPSGLAAAALFRAIGAHAWTFAGSGRFEAQAQGLFRRGAGFQLTHNPLCAGETSTAPVCAWHAAVFERLFQTLVSPRARCVETHCEARGDQGCRFSINW